MINPINMKSPRQNCPKVALLIESTRAYSRRMLEGIASYVRENDPWLLHIEPRSLTDPAPAWLKEWKGDGIIARITDRASAALLRETGLPIVNLKASGDVGLPPALVCNDQPAIGRMAAAHLLERGFRRFAVVGIDGLEWSDRRKMGFSQALEEAGCSVESYRPCENLKELYQDGIFGDRIQEVAAWLAGLPKPLGVLAVDDYIGLNLLNACRTIGINIPEEVAVVGVDNEPALCELSCPPLSSIIPGSHQVGREAARLLDSMMRGDPPRTDPVRIPPERLVVRQSSDIIAISDSITARALSYIREHACTGIQIEDVATFSGVSAATLQRRFRQWRNHSVYEEILQVRLKRARQLACETDLPLKMIADRVGYPHVEQLCNLFKKRTGQTLHKYRASMSASA
jgi:LacI family transcriptional regulator